MEKTIFLFGRKRGLSRAEFARHYIGHHAPLGVELVRTLKGYTVNLVRSDADFDAVTEHWIESVSDLTDPTRAFATPEDARRVQEDDQSFIGSHDLYIVSEEVETVPAERPPLAPGSPTPGVKIVWLLRESESGPPPQGVSRVVDNRVAHRLVYSSPTEWKKLETDIKVVRMAWASSLDSVEGNLSNALIVEEYRFIEAPPSGSVV